MPFSVANDAGKHSFRHLEVGELLVIASHTESLVAGEGGTLSDHELVHEPPHEPCTSRARAPASPRQNSRCHFLLQTTPGSTVFGISRSIAAGFPRRMALRRGPREEEQEEEERKFPPCRGQVLRGCGV